MATKSPVEIVPLADRVVVKPFLEKQEKVLASGIIIPETADKEKPMTGKVIAVGPGKYDDGDRIPMGVKVGQTVLFSKYGYDEIKIENETYYILSEAQVLAVLK